MFRIFFLSIFVFALSLVIYLFFYLGAYKSVTITREARGSMNLLYKAHTGAYHEIGASIREVEAWARNQNLDCPLTFGEYLDDPESMDQDRLRSRGGCVLLAPLNRSPEAFTYEMRPSHDMVVGHFQGSPAIGPFKVYPAIRKYLSTHNLTARTAVIETYKIDGDKVTTEYLFRVD